MTTVKPKILLVDDDPDLLRLLSIRLQGGGYTVTAVGGAEAALSQVAVSTPDVVITDLRMGGMDGMSLFESLQKKHPALPVIILTAHGTIPDAVAATQRGVSGYLTKPFDLSTMRAAVANAMERRAVSEEILSNNRKLVSLQEELHNQKLQEEIIRTKGEIYASIIHDINGPLTIIFAGIPLPFVSFGGSSMITTLLMIGLLEAIHVRGKLAGRR